MTEEEKKKKARNVYLLRLYGLTLEEFEEMAKNGCQICGAVPKLGRNLHVDHEHVRAFSKMPPEKKRQYVRGVLCWHCNNILLRRGITVERLRGATDYLERYTIKSWARVL